MAYKGQKVQKVMVQPINLIFRYLQNRSRIQIWLYEQVNMRIEGLIIGFDEYMNLVLDEAEEVHMKTKTRKTLGRILLKGDNITLLVQVSWKQTAVCRAVISIGEGAIGYVSIIICWHDGNKDSDFICAIYRLVRILLTWPCISGLCNYIVRVYRRILFVGLDYWHNCPTLRMETIVEII